jgi:hypothetical protein
MSERPPLYGRMNNQGKYEKFVGKTVRLIDKSGEEIANGLVEGGDEKTYINANLEKSFLTINGIKYFFYPYSGIASSDNSKKYFYDYEIVSEPNDSLMGKIEGGREGEEIGGKKRRRRKTNKKKKRTTKKRKSKTNKNK